MYHTLYSTLLNNVKVNDLGTIKNYFFARSEYIRFGLASVMASVLYKHTLFLRLYSEGFFSKFGEISFQEYVSKGNSHPVFYGDQVYKLSRVKCTAIEDRVCFLLIAHLLRLVGKFGSRKRIKPNQLGGCCHSNWPS